MTQQPPPGWYADPNNPALQRWWDGTAWTEQTQPTAQPVPVTAVQQGNMLPGAPDPRSAKAQAKADRAYRKASRPWPLRHPILSLLAAVVLIAIVATAASSGGGSNGSSSGQSETAGKVLQHTEDVKITGCGRQSTTNFLVAKVTVTNHSSKASDYVITVAFEAKPSGNQIDTGDVVVDSLQPGQTTVQKAQTLTSHGGPFRCVLSDAQRTQSSF